jgi:hypothetical protein
MTMLRIEFTVPDYARWKQTFDSDPAGRPQAGVRRHRIWRPVDDPNYVLVDLEFDGKGEAEAFLARLREVWRDMGNGIVQNPQGRVIEAVESKEY